MNQSPKTLQQTGLNGQWIGRIRFEAAHSSGDFSLVTQANAMLFVVLPALGRPASLEEAEI